MVRTGRGQAAVETVGVTVAIALLVAALAAWTAGNVRPPAAPPDVIGHVADPLGLTAQRVEQAWSRDDLPRWLDTAARGRGDRPVGRFLGRVALGVAATGRVGVRGAWNFRTHVERRVVERLEGLAHAPGQILVPPDPSLLTPGGIARDVLGRIGDPVAYVRSLRGLSAEEVVMRVTGDGGDLAGDVIVDVGQALVQKRVGGARAP